MGVNPLTGAPSFALSDREGRPRVRIAIKDDGRGTIEFLDAEGTIVSELTPEEAVTEPR